uniref:G-protein coupled receptors family 1 profile domain-containing protein n=1 Tax=Anopheles atroparvus TaxID=41427 RepID=A0A182J004_ANOAO
MQSKFPRDENTAVNHSGGHALPANVADPDGWRRPRSESSADAESVYMTNAVLPDGGYGHGMLSRRSSITINGVPKKPTTFFGGIKEWCIAWWHSGREDSDDYGYDVEEPSDLGYATPVSIETPLPSSVTRCTSLNVIRDPYVAGAGGRANVVSMIPDISPTPIRPALPPLAHLQDMHGARDSRSLPNSNRLGSRSVSQDSVYTILIRLPPEGGSGDERAPSIKMIQDDVPMSMTVPPRRPLPSRDSDYIIPVATRRQSTATTDFRLPLTAKIISKPLSKQQQQLHQANLAQTARQVKKKKKSQEKRQETKAAKTLSAILLSFIITWTPYNILVLLKPLTACTRCIPQELWDFFYALCYINSTINPVCYALCNASFRRTYVRILTCKWHTRNREAMTRGVYN